MSTNSCVSEADLRALLLGNLPEQAARAVELHLERCPTCEAAAQRLDAVADGFVHGLQEALEGDSAHGSTPRTPDAHPGATDETVSQRPCPSRVASYEILEELARGGMSVVYKTRQVTPNRVVAIKMLLAGAHASAERRARILAEADAIARLQHPNIVQIYEVGQDEGLPFLALEFMGGRSLAKKMADLPQPPRPAAALLETLARAVQYAHRCGVIHRDLKPDNVLLTEDGIPKITDFGLAKQERPELTTTGAILGTPSYMAPEQASGDNRAVGPAADVYALGAILYELLTGRPPFRGATVLDTLEQVRWQEPVAPTQLQARIPLDLETICLKFLHKDPPRRYATAADLADDLGRFLAGQPIFARPAGTWERAGKWARRRPALAVLLGLVAVLTVLGTGGVFWQRLRAEAALGEARHRGAETEQARQAEAAARNDEAIHRSLAETALARAETALHSDRMALAQRLWAENNVARVEQLLDLCRPEQRGWEWHYLRRLCRGHHHTLRGHTATVNSVAFSPDGRQLASSSRDRTVRLWDAVHLTAGAVLRGHGGLVGSVAFRPDGRLLASASVDRTIKLWDATSGRELATLKGHEATVTRVAFSADGERLASASDDQTVWVWDVAARQRLHRFAGHKKAVLGVAFSPDGRRIASSSRDATVMVWDAATGAVGLTFRGHDPANHVFGVAFSPGAFRGLPAPRRLRATSPTWPGLRQVRDRLPELPESCILSPMHAHGKVVLPVVRRESTS